MHATLEYSHPQGAVFWYKDLNILYFFGFACPMPTSGGQIPLCVYTGSNPSAHAHMIGPAMAAATAAAQAANQYAAVAQHIQYSNVVRPCLGKLCISHPELPPVIIICVLFVCLEEIFCVQTPSM